MILKKRMLVELFLGYDSAREWIFKNGFADGIQKSYGSDCFFDLYRGSKVVGVMYIKLMVGS